MRLNRGLADGRRGPVGIEDGADLMKAGVEHVQKKDTKNTKPKTISSKKIPRGIFFTSATSAVKITRPIPNRYMVWEFDHGTDWYVVGETDFE